MDAQWNAPDGNESLSVVAALANDLASRAVRSTIGQSAATDMHGPTDEEGSGAQDSQAESLAGVAALLGAVDRMHAATVVALMCTEQRRVIAEQGLTTESWLRAVARRTGCDAAMLMIAADRLADMPATLSAFCDGVLSWGTVRGIVSSVRVLTAGQRRWLDTSLAGDRVRLRRLDGDDAIAMADRLVEIARPDLHERRADRAAANQHLSFQPAMDGTATAHAALDAETFATVQQAIHTLTHSPSGRRVATNVEALRALARQRLTDVGLPEPQSDDGPSVAGDRGDGDEERVVDDMDIGAEALADPADRTDHADGEARARALEAGVGVSSVRTEMIVITDIGLLAGATDGIDHRGVDQLMAGTTVDDRVRATAQLLWRQDRPPVSLTPQAARRLACDATLRPVLTDGATALGTANPYARISAALRTALIARDGHCRFAGCHRPAEVCEAHHIVHRLDDGPTVLSNLALLCNAHHRAVHEGGWHPTLHDDASITFTRRGITLHSLPRRERLPGRVCRPPGGRRSAERPPRRSPDGKDPAGDVAPPLGGAESRDRHDMRDETSRSTDLPLPF